MQKDDRTLHCVVKGKQQVQPNILLSLQQRKPRRGCRGWWGHNRHGEFRVNHTYHTSDAKGAPTEASEDTSPFNKEKV